MKILIAILFVGVCVMMCVLYKIIRWLHRLLNVINRYEKLVDDLLKSLREMEK